jgi:hypothetical protein
VWTVAVLDGRTSVTFPAQFEELLPATQGGYSVGALEIPGFDAASFTVPDASATLTRLSADTIVVN